MSNTIYAVEVRNAYAAQDESSKCYSWHQWEHDEPEDSYEFETLDEARAKLAEIKAGWGEDSWSIVKTRRGLDTIEYIDATIWEIEVLEDGSYGDMNPLDGEFSFPAWVEDVADRAQCEYHDFLDYKTEDYPSFAAVAERMGHKID